MPAIFHYRLWDEQGGVAGRRVWCFGAVDLGILRADLAWLGDFAQSEINSARSHVPCRTWGARIVAEERSEFLELDLGLFAEFLDLFAYGVLEFVYALAGYGGEFEEGQLAAFGHGG